LVGHFILLDEPKFERQVFFASYQAAQLANMHRKNMTVSANGRLGVNFSTVFTTRRSKLMSEQYADCNSAEAVDQPMRGGTNGWSASSFTEVTPST
jgi:hypothetical protein